MKESITTGLSSYLLHCPTVVGTFTSEHVHPFFFLVLSNWFCSSFFLVGSEFSLMSSPTVLMYLFVGNGKH